MAFKRITSEDISHFQAICGEGFVMTDPESLSHYSHDETEDLKFMPEVVVKPESALEISAILSYCHQLKISVTPRAAGTGLSGGHYLFMAA